MSFAWPQLLWILFLPALWLGWELTHRRRSGLQTRPKILRAEAAAHSLNLLPSTAGASARSKPRWWLTAGLALGIVALARPQWGKLEEPVFEQSREILLAVDLSRSMLAPDVKPSRLERAKLLIRSLLEKLEGERVGLVVFSGTAFLQSPLSADYEILREFLPNLNPDFLPEGGTNYRALIDTSVSAFGDSGAADRFLIVLSDGEATDDDWKSQVGQLKKKGIRVIGLGVGTGAGAMIPDGAGGFVKDERGAVVLSKLESGTLQELAGATNGVYRDASTWVDLAALLKQTVETGQKGKFAEKNNVRLAERFQWPLAFGLWCVLASLCYEFPVRPRPREISLATPDAGMRKPQTGKTIPPIAATLLILLSGFRSPVSGFAADAPASAQPPVPLLSQIVGRLAGADNRSGRDWADLARETVAWGQNLQASQQPVPEGPVRDALAAVELGSAADPKTTDWSKTHDELQALLKKSEEKKNPQKQDKPQQNQDQKDQDQKQEQEQDSKSSSPDQKSSEQKQPESSPKPDGEPEKKPESAFGDMKEKAEPPPPPQSDTQKVGGAPEKKPDAEASDPSLVQPLQKLDQLRNEDSPARLFQLMEGERKPTPAKKGKDW